MSKISRKYRKSKKKLSVDAEEFDEEYEMEQNMDKQPVPLYISDNLSALNLLVKDSTFKGLKKVDRLPALANRLLTELLQVQNDQEKYYIIAKRYLNLMDQFFKLSDDKSFAEIRYRSEYMKVQNIVKDLENDLTARYKELAQKQADDVVTKDKDKPSTSASTPYIKPTVDDAGAGDDKDPIFDKTYITPVDLYNALLRKVNLLIVDIRPANDFSESFISADEGHVINIPADILVPGLSANTLGQRLEGVTREIWNRRDTFDVIVLMDWDTDEFNFAGSKIERLRVCIVEWDFNRVYRQEPVILRGGLKEFLEWYPTEVSNSFVFLSQTNSELEDILTLDEVSYPEAGSGLGRNLKEGHIISFTDIHARIKRDFGDAEDLGNAPRGSRSEGQLPKDFYSSQEGVSPYRSLSQESLPKDYYSVESITEPPPTTIIESEAHKEIIFERDIEEPTRDQEAEIKSAIEGDRTFMLYKARSLKPKVGPESPRASPREIIIKNLIEENKDLFKPPAVDRSYKPFQPVPFMKPQGMVGDGYTGIRNLRNNCYMNCMLQCLKVLPLVKSMFVTSNSYLKHIHKDPPIVTAQFASTMKTLWEGTMKKNRSYYPQMFFEKVYELNPVYNRGNHEDTFEFFIFLFNQLSEDCSFDLVRPKVMTDRERSWYSQLQGRSSYFVDLFYYQLKNTKICWRCQKPNLNFDSDSSLMLPVPVKNESVRLEALLKEYLKENLVSEYSCSECKSSATIVNRKAIVIDPEVLAVVLKRYVAEKDGTFRKNELEIEFPTDKLEFGSSYYRLYSIPQHTGSMTHGHYYASVLLNDEQNQWVLFNDERVTSYNCPITEVPGIKSSCVGFFYVRQGAIKIE